LHKEIKRLKNEHEKTDNESFVVGTTTNLLNQSLWSNVTGSNKNSKGNTGNFC
jgi:hypothetical protein